MHVYWHLIYPFSPVSLYFPLASHPFPSPFSRIPYLLPPSLTSLPLPSHSLHSLPLPHIPSPSHPFPLLSHPLSSTSLTFLPLPSHSLHSRPLSLTSLILPSHSFSLPSDIRYDIPVITIICIAHTSTQTSTHTCTLMCYVTCGLI